MSTTFYENEIAIAGFEGDIIINNGDIIWLTTNVFDPSKWDIKPIQKKYKVISKTLDSRKFYKSDYPLKVDETIHYEYQLCELRGK